MAMSKTTKYAIGAGILALLFYLFKSGKLSLPGIGTNALTEVNPNWPKDDQGNALTPGTIVNPSAAYPQGGVVNMYGYVK